MVDRTADFKAALRQRRTVLGLQTPPEEQRLHVSRAVR